MVFHTRMSSRTVLDFDRGQPSREVPDISVLELPGSTNYRTYWLRYVYQDE